MGHVVQTNGDYIIKTAEAGTIILDTGQNVGTVRVTGNLIVTGDTLTVSADNLNVKDNIIALNFGETGAGVTLEYSGIQIDRGTLPPAGFIFDENSETWVLAANNALSAEGASPIPFNFNNSNLRLRRILTDADTDGGDLILIGTGTGVVKVSGTVNYEDQVLNDDDIPNKKYVDDAIISQPSFQMISDDTRVIIAEADRDPGDPGSLTFFQSETGYSTFGRSAVNVIVDSELVSQFYEDKFLVGRPGQYGIEVDGINFEIRTETSVSNQNILVKTAGTGKLQTNYAIQLDNISAAPAFVVDSTVLHSRTPSVGTTGLYFVNSTANGELISKNKALLFSMLF